MEKIINVGFIGNPNCGKTTLFNAYTGANLKVANWPGVTVEKKEGFTTYEDQKFRLIDLPGIYSLTSYTMEETVSRECIMSDEVDVIVDVIDASSLERNLYLALQLIELGKPVVLALNMMDEVRNNGGTIEGTGTFNASVQNQRGGGIILSGTFGGEISYNHNIIRGGTFSGALSNDGTIEGGTFSGAVTTTEGGIIEGGTFTLCREQRRWDDSGWHVRRFRDQRRP